MKNYEIDAAWQYHNGTKHPNGALLNRFHTYRATDRPIMYKIYKKAPRIDLVLDKRPSGVSALDAISDSVEGESISPNIDSLTKILYFSAGITKTIRFAPPLDRIEFRAASCTGALYHIEVYIICGNIPGLEAGIYHFDPKAFSLTTLRKGDYRSVLSDATAGESFASRAPLFLVFSDVFSRNSIKYQAREYRHAFWDCGTMLANSLAMARAHRLQHRLILGFVDSKVNMLLGLNPKREAALAILPLGQSQAPADRPTLQDATEEEPPEHDMYYEAIDKMHQSSSLTSNEEVLEWRKNTIQKTEHQRSNQVSTINYASSEDDLESVIQRRGSTRKFSHDAITLAELTAILKRSTEGVDSDFEENVMINEIYLIANAVDGLENGSYFYNGEDQSLELLQKGDLRDVSGHLGLDQSLPYDASVTIFFMIDLQMILKRFGNRGYRVAQMDASIAAGRMYLAAYALCLGATGLTFYDDEVKDFFSPHASNMSVMFMLAVGKKSKV